MSTAHRFFSVAAIGSASSVSTFSGIPYHFYHALKKSVPNTVPWEMDLTTVNWERRIWNLVQLLRLEKPGGFQYTSTFANKLMSQIPAAYLKSNVISFNQHFPPIDAIVDQGGKMYYYIDATFSQLLDRYGIADQVGKKITKKTLAREKDRFEKAEMIFTFQQWAKNSVVKTYGIDERKVKVILPGANVQLEQTQNSTIKVHNPEAGKNKPFVLGFVGKDWKRKGLLVLAEVRDLLEKRGWNVIVRCAGNAPEDFNTRKGVEFVGFIDKHENATAFMEFLVSCDMGCLFSEAEFSSIAIFEFLSVGVPVAGFVVDGMGDLFFPEASLRFDVNQSTAQIADRFSHYLQTESERVLLQQGAAARSSYVTWDRAVAEIIQYIEHTNNA